jgi:YD repeat-containing protein
VYSYDGSGRVEEINLVPYRGSGTPISYVYRVDGTVSSVTDEVGTTSYTYTAGRKVETVSYDWSASGLTNAQVLEYGYNPDSTLLSLEWKDGTTTVASWTYDYDGAGRTTEVVNSFGETTTFTFDGVGKLKTQVNENGTNLTYTYNQDRGWPTQIVYKLGTTPFASYDLEYVSVPPKPFLRGVVTLGDFNLRGAMSHAESPTRS